MNTTMYIYSSTVLVQFWCVCTLLEYTHYFTTSATEVLSHVKHIQLVKQDALLYMCYIQLIKLAPT